MVFTNPRDTINKMTESTLSCHASDAEIVAKYEDCESEDNMIERGIVIIGVDSDENRALKSALLSRFSHVSICSHLPAMTPRKSNQFLLVDDDPLAKLHALAERISHKELMPETSMFGRIPAGMSPRQEGNESHPLFWRKNKSKRSRRG